LGLVFWPTSAMGDSSPQLHQRGFSWHQYPSSVTHSWITLRLLSIHHPLVSWQKNPRVIEKKLLIVSYQSKSSSDIVNLFFRWKGFTEKWGLPSFAKNSDTLKGCELIGYKDSRRNLSKCFKTISWLRIDPRVTSGEKSKCD
jgi:hypothetical protein